MFKPPTVKLTVEGVLRLAMGVPSHCSHWKVAVPLAGVHRSEVT